MKDIERLGISPYESWLEKHANQCGLDLREGKMNFQKDIAIIIGEN